MQLRLNYSDCKNKHSTTFQRPSNPVIKDASFIRMGFIRIKAKGTNNISMEDFLDCTGSTKDSLNNILNDKKI